MRTKFFIKGIQLMAAIIVLLTSFAASPAQVDEPITGGIISAGFHHTCALKPDGSVDCWGENAGGQAEDQPGPYTQVSTSIYHTCALTPIGAVDCWGSNAFGQAEDQPGPYIQISVGGFHSCALTPAGAVDCWGWNAWGEAEDQPGPYTQVSAGNEYTCALTPSGAADCWGDNYGDGYYGHDEDQPGPFTQVSAGEYHTCALTSFGAVDCSGVTGEDQPGPYTQVGVSGTHTCALTPTGAVDCWGGNFNGEAEDQPGPYTQVSVGFGHTCALTPAGAVDCWGRNDYGQSEDQLGPYGPYQPIGDTIPPVVTVTGVTEGSTYTLGSVPQSGCSTIDEGSGVAVEASLSLTGGNALGVGSFTATCSGALDNAGNSGNTAIVHYNINFLFTGFTSPVDNSPVMNIAKAGQTIPLKWRLTDANGDPIANLTGVTVSATSLSCDAGTTGDLIEEYTGGDIGLQNLGDGYYQWNWKTPTIYANSCKTVSLNLGESAGSEHTALFQFRR